MSGRRDRFARSDDPVERERVRRDSAPRPSAVSASQASVLANPNAYKRDAHDPDYVILVTVVALTAIGILMVYAASAIPSYAQSQNTFELVAPQVLAGLLGFGAMIFLMNLDYRYLRLASLALAIVALAMLVIVVVPLPGPLRGLSVSHNGSTRWIHMGPLPDISPAEVAKLALVVYLAHWLASRGPRIRSFLHGTIPFAIIVVPFLILVVRQPDLGTAVVMVVIAFLLYFAAGAKLLHAALMTLVGGVGGVFLMLDVGHYPVDRIQCLLNPWADPQGNCYQVVQGLQALGTGGFFGIGLGNNRVVGAVRRQRLHLLGHCPGARPGGRGSGHRPLRRPRVRWHPDRHPGAGHVRRLDGGRNHGLAVLPGAGQRRRGGARVPGHGDYAAVRFRRRFVVDGQSRGRRDPAFDLEGNSRTRLDWCVC